MHAQAGDELLVRGCHEGDGDRRGTVIQVKGENGEPPYLVRWRDGHESVFFPSSGTEVRHHAAQEAAG